MRQFRVGVQKETIKAFKELGYTHAETKKLIALDGPKIAAEIEKAKFYKDASALAREVVAEKQEIPTIEVVNMDCLLEALRLKKLGFNPLVLNMASNTNVGGGYKTGAGAQEENLFRRTNLFEYHEPKKNEWYPIPESGGIYCPNATVIRSSEEDKYSFLEVPEKMSFVAVAALRRPKIISNPSGEHTIHPEAKTKTRKKIQAILNIGLENGAYRNPPNVIAQLFYEVISAEYAGGGENLPRTYRHISFAIIDDHNANKKHNTEGNYIPFQRRFANGIIVKSHSHIQNETQISEEGRNSTSSHSNDEEMK
ncbi:27194_t:CDS:2 [Dentiscutata erythropus]|uniref:27194_t:CDS:1 n=1 Tax=Dentiscutata erythropus TaxID=1348616 RepID=A0A9N9IIN2_9GLOM|nr:27194_t:CDS:2 [Dentiscutata erythropus]